MRSGILPAVILCASVAVSALAQVDAKKEQAKPAEKPAASSSAPVSTDYSKEAYVIEQLHTVVAEQADGTGTREYTSVIRILAEAGVKAFAVLNFTYTSANETVDVDYVRVRKPDGTVVKTPDYNIQDMPADVTRSAPLYSDIHEKHVAVKGLGVGDVLEYLVRYRVVKPEVPGHFWFEDSFLKTAIVKDCTLEISMPADKYVKVVSPEFKPEIKEEAGRRIYRWSHPNLQVKEKDPDELPRRIPPNPDVQLTTFASWDDVGRWYGGLQKEPVTVTPPIQVKAAELTKGLKSDDEKIRALYTFVSLKFHYIGLDFGIGRYQPHAAEDVLDNGYGDCKDKHTLLASLLKAEGYDAWPALIHASRKLDPEVPSPAQFNHVITVVAKAGGGYTWLDTTPEVAPYGLLMQQLRNKQALVIPNGAPAVLMTTPQNPPTPQRQEFSMEGTLASDGTFTGHAEQSYEGDVGVLLRAAFRQLPESQWKDGVQGFSRGLNFAGDVSNVKVSPPDEIDKPFEISYDYVRKNFGDWENHRTIAPLPPMGLEIQKDAKDRKPPEPLQLGALGKVTYRSRLKLPAGYEAIGPSPVRLVEPYVEYTNDTRVEQGVITTTRELVIKKNEVPLSDWEEYRKFGIALSEDEFGFIQLRGAGGLVELGKKDAGKDSAKDGADKGKTDDEGSGNEKASTDDVNSLFRQAQDAAQERDVRRTQELLERVLALDPKYPRARLSLGSLLFMTGEIDAGMAQFHKAQEDTPNDVQAYQFPAAALARMGRTADSIAEWRRLLKVSPQNGTAASALGELLSLQEKYPEAAQEFETALKAAPDSRYIEFQLGSAYLKMGQTEKAVVQIRAAVEEDGHPKPNPMMLNNAAYALADSNTSLNLAKLYAETAAKQLDEQSPEDVENFGLGTQSTYEFSLLWDTLGWVYYQSGETNRSESLVRSAWLLGQEALVGEHLGEIYEKQGKGKEAARAYALALAALNMPSSGLSGGASYPGMPAPSAQLLARQKLANEITARYQKLTGKKPTIRDTWRLPNGDWSKSVVEQFNSMRSVKLGKLPNLSGSAEFTIVFGPEKIESVEFVSGQESLKALIEKMKAAHYQVEFPEGSHARLLRRAELSCFPASGCMAVLMPPEKAQIRNNVGQ